jgi:hypothetical protein
MPYPLLHFPYSLPHSLLVVEVLGGVLRSNGGHKTWVAWAIAGVLLVTGILFRLYRRR